MIDAVTILLKIHRVVRHKTEPNSGQNEVVATGSGRLIDSETKLDFPPIPGGGVMGRDDLELSEGRASTKARANTAPSLNRSCGSPAKSCKTIASTSLGTSIESCEADVDLAAVFRPRHPHYRQQKAADPLTFHTEMIPTACKSLVNWSAVPCKRSRAQ